MHRLAWPGHPKTLTEALKEQLDEATRKLRTIEMERTRERLAGLEAQAKIDAELESKAKDKENAALLKAKRRSSWLQHKTDEAFAKGNDAFVSFLSQPDLINRVVEEG